MAAAHHPTHRPQYQLPPPPGYNDDLRLPSIKDLAFSYERPRQDPPPPTHTSQPIPEYAPSSQERAHQWKRPPPHAAPPPAMPAHHQHLPQQHNPPLSAGHEVPSRPDEYPPPKHHDNGGYITSGGPAMAHLPGSGAPVRNDDHAHLHPNKRARTSQTPIASSRDTRPQQSPYPPHPPPYQHQPQYPVAPPPPSPYPPVSSAPPTTHQAPPPPSPHPMHHPHHHQQSPPHGYSQYGQQYIPGRPVHLPPHHTTHHVQPQHTPQHTPVAAPLPPPPSGVQSQPPPNPQPVSYSSSAPPTVPPTAPPDHWEHHHQSHQPHPPPAAPVHHIHHQPPPPPPPPPSHAPVQHGQPPQHYSHLPPPPLPQQPIPANVPAPASAPPPPQAYSHPPPPPQHSQTFTRSSIAPSEIEHRPTSTSYPPAEPEKNPAREKTMAEIVQLCSILYDFASRYAQLTAYAQPSSTEIAEMANKANEVVRLLEELRRMNMPEAERVKQPEVSAVPIAAATIPPSPDDHRPPKRPWEDMSQDGQVSAQTESSVVFAEPYTAPAPAPAPAEPAPTPQSTAEQDMELIRTKRATTAAGAAAAAGQPKTKYRKRSRATPPGKCHSCNIKETPEWRRGPDGARTLCNACGLHYAKLMRKQSKMNLGPNGEPPPPIDMDTLRASTRAAEAEKNSRQKIDNDRNASPATNSAPATPLTSQHHHQGSFQIVSVQPEQATSASSTSSSSEARTTHLSLGQPPPPPWTSRSFSNTTSEQLQHQSFLRSSHVPETSPR